MKKIIQIFFVIAFVYGCEDQVIGNKTEVKTRDSVNTCPDPDYPTAPNLSFTGVDKVDSIFQNKFKVHWTAHGEESGFLVFLKRPNQRTALYKILDSSKESAWVEGLLPNSEYVVSVKALDERGLYDLNDKSLTVSTNDLPAYTNAKSLYFDGSSSVALKGGDEIFPKKGFTVSLWFKTSYRQTVSEGRLITLHQGFAAASSLGAGVSKDQVFVHFRNSEGERQDIVHEFPYHDGQWHHLAVAYNGKYISVYFDGRRIKVLEDSFAGFGSHPVHIGSYTGSQKGFTGMIDEVSLWSTAMSSPKIQNIYNEGNAADLRRHPRSNSLAVWHRLGDDLNDGSSRLYDQMENAHGTPLNVQAEDFLSDSP